MKDVLGSLPEVITAYKNYNLLVPTATDVQLNPFYKFHVEEVPVDLGENSGDIFKVGSVKTGKQDERGKDIWEDVYSLSKPLLNKMAMAAGIQFNPKETYGERIDRVTYRAQAQGAMRKADGTARTETDQKGAFEQDYIKEPKSEYQIKIRGKSTKLYNHKASNHKQVAIDKLKLIPPEQGKECLPEELHGKQKFKTTWGRLKWDTVSPTIDTRFDASSNGTNNHPFLNRAITPREAARIQSFDDEFVFWGAKVHIRKQIGNAVPPLLAEAIANRIAEYFGLKKE